MVRYVSRKGSQPVRLERAKYEGRSKIAQLLVLFVITSDVIPQELGLRSQRRELALEWGDIVGGSIFLGFEREQRPGLFAELELKGT
jgi:hypothetical protein